MSPCCFGETQYKIHANVWTQGACTIGKGMYEPVFSELRLPNWHFEPPHQLGHIFIQFSQ